MKAPNREVGSFFAVSSMLNGEWEMGNGKWEMGNGAILALSPPCGTGIE